MRDQVDIPCCGGIIPSRLACRRRKVNEPFEWICVSIYRANDAERLHPMLLAGLGQCRHAVSATEDLVGLVNHATTSADSLLKTLQDTSVTLNATMESVDKIFIVQDIGAENSAIGFASYFFSSRRTRPLALSANDTGPYFLPTQQNCLDGKYPLSRFLYVYVNKKPGASLSPLAGHLLGFICSKQGQETSAKEGNYPLNAEVSAKECFGNL